MGHFGLMARIAAKEFKQIAIKDRGMTLCCCAVTFGVSYATWYTYYLATKGPEVNYLRGSNADPWVQYGSDYQQKWINWGELQTKHIPKAGPAEAYEAIGQKAP